MAYADLEHAVNEMGPAVRQLSVLYGAAGDALDAAGTIDTGGAVQYDRSSVRTALDIVLPPGFEAAADRVAQVPLLGFAEVALADGEVRPVMPWSALTDAQMVQALDQEFWKALGYPKGVRRARRRPFVNEPPAEVNAAENVVMLDTLSTTSRAAEYKFPPEAEAVLMIRLPMPILPGLLNMKAITPPPPTDTSSATATSKQHLKAEDFAPLVSCLGAATCRFVHLGFTLEICLNRTCADALEGILSLGMSTVFALGLAAFTKGFTAAVTAAAGALGVGVGGWIALGIIVSAAYWALMIHANKTPKGVCLYIPMPWTLGLVGPGWAVGIR